MAGHEPPTGSEAVKAVLRGIRRTIGSAKQGKAPATADLIGQMIALCPDNMIGRRDRGGPVSTLSVRRRMRPPRATLSSGPSARFWWTTGMSVRDLAAAVDRYHLERHVALPQFIDCARRKIR